MFVKKYLKLDIRFPVSRIFAWRGKFSSHAMRLEGCKRKLPQWHTDYADATDDHRFLFRSMLIAHRSSPSFGDVP